MTRKTKPRAPMPKRSARSPHLLSATSRAARCGVSDGRAGVRRADADAALDMDSGLPALCPPQTRWHAALVKHQPHPRETVERCALRAQLRGDPMLGTAFPAARILLVEQPGPWGERGLRDSRFG